MIDYAKLERGAKLEDADGDEHTFIAYVPETKQVVTLLDGMGRCDLWDADDYFKLPSKKWFLNVYGNGIYDPDLHETREQAEVRANALGGCIARVRVTFAQGQFD